MVRKNASAVNCLKREPQGERIKRLFFYAFSLAGAVAPNNRAARENHARQIGIAAELTLEVRMLY